MEQIERVSEIYYNDNMKFICNANIMESYVFFFFFRKKKKHYFEMLISIKYKFKIHRQIGNKKIVNLQIQYLCMRQQFIYSFYKCIETDIHNVTSKF